MRVKDIQDGLHSDPRRLIDDLRADKFKADFFVDIPSPDHVKYPAAVQSDGQLVGDRDPDVGFHEQTVGGFIKYLAIDSGSRKPKSKLAGFQHAPAVYPAPAQRRGRIAAPPARRIAFGDSSDSHNPWRGIFRQCLFVPSQCIRNRIFRPWGAAVKEHPACRLSHLHRGRRESQDHSWKALLTYGLNPSFNQTVNRSGWR